VDEDGHAHGATRAAPQLTSDDHADFAHVRSRDAEGRGGARHGLRLRLGCDHRRDRETGELDQKSDGGDGEQCLESRYRLVVELSGIDQAERGLKVKGLRVIDQPRETGGG